MIITIALGIVAACIILSMLGFVIEVAGVALESLMDHLGSVLGYGLLAFVLWLVCTAILHGKP